MNDFWTTVASLANAVIEPVAGLLSWTGDWAWGWALVIIAVGWRLPLLRTEVADASARITRTRLYDRFATGRDMRSRAARAEVGTQVRAELEDTTGGPAPHPRLRAVRAAVQVLAVVMVIVWSRYAPQAQDAEFGGLTRLDESAAGLGVAGWTWALSLGLLFAATALLVHAAAGTTSRHQKVFGAVLGPVFFTVLGLLLPAGTLVAFVAGVALSLTATATAAARRPVPATGRVEQAA